MKLSAFITFLCVFQSFKTSYRSVLPLAFANSKSTMTSADFLDFSYVSLHRLLLLNSFPQCISKTSPGKSIIFLSIYLPHLHYLFSSSYRASVCLATLPIGTALYVISVRQTRDLPPTSFKFHLTMDTLVLSYTLTTTRAC